MAFPTVQARFTYVSPTTNSTTASLTQGGGGLPNAADIVAGDLIVVILAADGDPTLTVNTGSSTAGWAKLGQASNGVIVTGAVFSILAPTTGVAVNLDVDSTQSQQYSAVTYQLRGSSLQIEGTSANGSSTNSDPPNHALAGGTAKDCQWIATRSGDSTVVATVAPTNYNNLQSQAGGGTNGASSNGADRQLNASAENPGTFTSANEQWVSWTLAVYVGVVNTTLTAAAGSYSLTGTAAGLRADRRITAAVGSYAYTGTAAGLAKGVRLAVDPGSYSLTGTAAVFARSYRLAAAVGSYALTGTAAGLLRGLRLAGAVGSYAVTGTAAGLLRGLKAAVDPGAYTLTGTAATFLRGLRIAPDVGNYALTGTDAALKAGRLLTGAVGAYAYTGTAATLTTGAASTYTLVAAAGSYALAFEWAWSARDPGASAWGQIATTSPSWGAVSPSSPSWSPASPTSPTWTPVTPTSPNWS